MDRKIKPPDLSSQRAPQSAQVEPFNGTSGVGPTTFQQDQSAKKKPMKSNNENEGDVSTIPQESDESAQQSAQVEPVSGTSWMGPTTFQQDQSAKMKPMKSNNENEGDVSTIPQESDESVQYFMDRRGILRGKCLLEDCDCSQYELPADSDIHYCSYCGDPPAKHLHVQTAESEKDDKEPEAQQSTAQVEPVGGTPGLGCKRPTTSQPDEIPKKIHKKSNNENEECIQVEIVQKGPITVGYGGTIKINANIISNSTGSLQVNWQKTHNNCSTTLKINRFKYSGSSCQVNNPQLVINNVDKEDAGIYNVEVISPTEIKNSPGILLELYGDEADSLSKEENNFFRLYFLNQKIATQAVQLFFDSKVLDSFLKQHKSSLTSQSSRYRCTKDQEAKLFPGGHVVVASADFDLSLLYNLIRNLLTVISAPTCGWGKQPLPGHLTETDDIERIQHLGNNLAQNSDFKICDRDFSTHWIDLSQAIDRLSRGSLSTDVESMRTKKLEKMEEDIREYLKKIPEHIPLNIRNEADSLSKEESNFFRLYFLNQKIATQAVQLLFDSKVLDSFLKQHKSSLPSQSSFYRCTKDQEAKLFPGGHVAVVSTDFDFTLLYKLIRNLLTAIPAPTCRWGNPPLPGHLNEADDIERIRHLRNNFAHNSEFEICDTDFSTHWTDLSQAIDRLSKGSLSTDVESMRTKRFDKGIKNEMEEDIQKELKEIREEFMELQQQVANNTQEIHNINTRKIPIIIYNGRNISIDINELVFCVKTHICEQLRSQKITEESMETECATSTPQTSQPQSTQSKNENKYRVEWKLATPNTWNVSEMKNTLQNVSNFLNAVKPCFEIEFVYIGSLVIRTIVPEHILSNYDDFKSAVRSFLAKIVEVCQLDTDTHEVVKVDLNIFTEILPKAALSMLTEKGPTDIGIDKADDRSKILKFIGDISDEPQRKVFNDSVHGHIEIHPLCVKIIDTPQFQRLRYLKQMGACYFVYPGAAHNRFEHSIGVCHLAGQLARTLKERQPELDITNLDILCVEIAGLCHDLGHGPFSHLFDGKFIPTVRPDIKWKHEDASVMMFDHMLTSNSLKGEFEKYGLTKQDIIFIREQIAGPPKDNQKKGREEKKEFLYEIVANKRNGIDVDKWDYFARDCHGLGMKNNFDHHRFMKLSRVLEVDGSFQICSRDKEVDSLYSMFQIRATLHKRAVQHRVRNAIETMITDAFIHANKKELIPGKDGNLVKISECIDDPVAYTHLNDNIYHLILLSQDEDLAESRKILQKIERRELYKCVGQTTPVTWITRENAKQIEKDIKAYLPPESHDQLKPDDLDVQLVNLDYGMKTENPIDNVRFYNKNDVTKAIRLNRQDVSLMLPVVFDEQMIRLYCKKTDETSLQLAKDCFQKGCYDNGLIIKQDSITPEKCTAIDSTNSEKMPDKKPEKLFVSAGKLKHNLCHFKQC